jgi:hypothetical protein
MACFEIWGLMKSDLYSNSNFDVDMHVQEGHVGSESQEEPEQSTPSIGCGSYLCPRNNAHVNQSI